jgi:hypothetical protein
MQSIQSHPINTEAYRASTTASHSGYVILSGENQPVSKSLQSKIKNLLHTLSTPFRALIRIELGRRIGQGTENSGGLINIKSTPMSRSSTNDRKVEFASQPERGYTIISTKEGYGKPSLFDRIWG